MKGLSIRFCILVIFLSFAFLPTNTLANEFLDFWLDPLSSETYVFQCLEGDCLRGDIVITLDGEYYEGDQQKYDLWVGWGLGIDLYIMNRSSYDYWTSDGEAISFYAKNDVTSLSLDVTIPNSGTWYVIIENDSSVYGKQIEGSIIHESQSKSTNLVFGLVGIVSILVVVLGIHYLRKKA
jgi:hypothetical protein